MTKKKGDDGAIGTSDELDLLVQKLRWLKLPGMTKLVISILEHAAKDNLSTLDVIHRLCDGICLAAATRRLATC